MGKEYEKFPFVAIPERHQEREYDFDGNHIETGFYVEVISSNDPESGPIEKLCYVLPDQIMSTAHYQNRDSKNLTNSQNPMSEEVNCKYLKSVNIYNKIGDANALIRDANALIKDATALIGFANIGLERMAADNSENDYRNNPNLLKILRRFE